jgi:hypothetical protein
MSPAGWKQLFISLLDGYEGKCAPSAEQTSGANMAISGASAGGATSSSTPTCTRKQSQGMV